MIMVVRKIVYVLFIGILILSTGCAKRVSPPTQSSSKIEINKQDLMQLVSNDMHIDDKEAMSARLQTELLMTGDRLQLTIYEKLPVSQESRIEMKRIDKEGKIFLLPIGEIKLEGMRVADAEQLIEQKFSKLVVAPHCEIMILEKQYEPRVYVFGEVMKSGAVKFRPGDRLLDAISQALGCSDNAYKRSIKVVRTVGDKVTIYSIDLLDIFSAGNVYNNIVLQDQDIIFVPRRFITGLRETLTVLAQALPYYLFIQNIYR